MLKVVLRATVQRLTKALIRTGMVEKRLNAIGTTATRVAGARVTAIVNQAYSYSVAQQREINRSFLPQIQEKMQQGYVDAVHAPVRSALVNIFTRKIFLSTNFHCDFARATDLFGAFARVVRGGSTV